MKNDFQRYILYLPLNIKLTVFIWCELNARKKKIYRKVLYYKHTNYIKYIHT